MTPQASFWQRASDRRCPKPSLVSQRSEAPHEQTDAICVVASGLILLPPSISALAPCHTVGCCGVTGLNPSTALGWLRPQIISTSDAARDHETLSVAPLLDKLHTLGIDPETAALDKGYDNNRVYATCSERNIAPVVPLRKTPDVVKGKDKPPTCEHGEWRFAGADYDRKATKWRCPRPASASPPPCGSRPTGCTR